MMIVAIAVAILSFGLALGLFFKHRALEARFREHVLMPVPKREADALARSRIGQAISAHMQYESAHIERRGRKHGRYDTDQARIAVYQRVVRMYHAAKQIPPDGLLALVADAFQGND